MTQKGRDGDKSEKDKQIKYFRWTCVVETQIFNFWRRVMSRRVSAVLLPPLRSARPPSITRGWTLSVSERLTHSSLKPLNTQTVIAFMVMPSGVSSCRRAFRWRVQVRQLKPATLYKCYLWKIQIYLVCSWTLSFYSHVFCCLLVMRSTRM